MLRACLRENLGRVDPSAAEATRGRRPGPVDHVGPRRDRADGRAVPGAGTHELRAVMAWHCHAILDVDGATAEAAALSQEVRDGHAPVTVALAALCLEALLRLRTDVGVGTSPSHDALRSVWRANSRTSGNGLLAVVAPEMHQAALHLGAPALADEVLRTVRDRLAGTDQVSLMEAAEHAAHRRTTEAARWLAAVDLVSPRALDPVTALRGRVLKAVLAARDGDRAAAHGTISQALATADRTRVLLPLLDHPLEVSAILAEGLGRFGRLNALAEQVRGLVAAPDTDEELTAREAQVLTELASLRTVPEMAQALGVSENTVKTHLRNVYRKLGTSSRRQTLLAARRGGLL
jgi:LuxR family maltose regulon positive regulatory protein